MPFWETEKGMQKGTESGGLGTLLPLSVRRGEDRPGASVPLAIGRSRQRAPTGRQQHLLIPVRLFKLGLSNRASSFSMHQWQGQDVTAQPITRSPACSPCCQQDSQVVCAPLCLPTQTGLSSTGP